MAAVSQQEKTRLAAPQIKFKLDHVPTEQSPNAPKKIGKEAFHVVYLIVKSS